MSWQTEDKYIIRIGGAVFQNVENILVFQGESFFRVERETESGSLGISFPIYNSAGEKIAAVKRNNIYDRDTDEISDWYYFEGEHQEMRFLRRGTVLEKGSATLICRIQRNERASPNELNVFFDMYLPNGTMFQATPSNTNFGSSQFQNVTMRNCKNGIGLG